MIDSVSTPGLPRGPSTSAITPFAVVQRRGKADHLDDHFVVGLGVLRAGIADVDRPGEQRAVDLHVGRAARLEIRADELVRLPLDDFDDLAARAGIAAPRLSSVPPAPRRRWRRRRCGRPGCRCLWRRRARLRPVAGGRSRSLSGPLKHAHQAVALGRLGQKGTVPFCAKPGANRRLVAGRSGGADRRLVGDCPLFPSWAAVTGMTRWFEP